MVHNLHEVRDVLVMAGLDEPLAEIALDGDVKHFLLLTRQVPRLDLLLELCKLGQAHVHHVQEGVLGTQPQLVLFAERLGQR